MVGRKPKTDADDDSLRLFMGAFEYSLDEQRRLPLPAAWQKPPRFFLFPWNGRCVQVVPPESFREVAAKLQRSAWFDPDAGRALASLGSLSQECRLDRQGRIILARDLMQYAGIVDKVRVVGAFNTIQLWEPENWARSRMSDEQSLSVLKTLNQKPDDLTVALRSALKPGEP